MKARIAAWLIVIGIELQRVGYRMSPRPAPAPQPQAQPAATPIKKPARRARPLKGKK